LAIEKQKSKKNLINVLVMPKPPKDVPPPVKTNPRLRRFMKP
jgi:hypothetical protein